MLRDVSVRVVCILRGLVYHELGEWESLHFGNLQLLLVLLGVGRGEAVVQRLRPSRTVCLAVQTFEEHMPISSESSRAQAVPLLPDMPQPAVLPNLAVLTTKEYMRVVSEIKPEWLVEIAPHYYSKKVSTPCSRWVCSRYCFVLLPSAACCAPLLQQDGRAYSLKCIHSAWKSSQRSGRPKLPCTLPAR